MTCTGTLSKTQGWEEVELCFDSVSLSNNAFLFLLLCISKQVTWFCYARV